MAPFKRRCASAVIMYDKLIIYGGMDEQDQNKNEIMMYGITNNSWLQLNEKMGGINIPNLSMHASAAVITQEFLNDEYLDIHNHPITLKTSVEKRIYNLGIYYFGGLTQSIINNDVTVVEAINKM